MPFSAGPNIAARPNLVFEYDTGDVQNSYKGQPTTNLANFDVASAVFSTDTPGNLTQTPNSTEATYQGRLSKKMSVGAGYWNAYIYNYNTGVSSTVFAVSYKVKLANGAHPNTIIAGGYIYGSAGTFFPAPTFTFLGDGWYLASMLYSGTSMTLNSLTGMNGTGPGVFYITDYQAEAKPQPTPFAGVAGTRSNTQGLLDVSGYNRTMSLANVSFTNTIYPQITFDGTDDYIYAILFPSAPSVMSAEFVFYKTTSSNTDLSYQGFAPRFALRSNQINLYHATAGQTGDVNFACTINTNTYYHVVLTFDAVNKYQCYLNTVSLSRSYNGDAANGVPGFTETYIGYQAGSEGYFAGSIPICRYYDYALSAQEVRRNYNQLKGRFNLI